MKEKQENKEDKNRPAKKSLFGRILKYTWITLLSILLLLVVLILLIRLPGVQNYLKDKAVTYLENKIQTKVNLDNIYLTLPSGLEINGLYLEDQNKDTLIYVKNLNAGIQAGDLLRNKISVTEVLLDGLRATVSRNDLGEFNFDYIVNAFASEEEKESSPSQFQTITIDKIQLKDIAARYKDAQSGMDVDVKFNDFNTAIDLIDLKNNNYEIDDIRWEGLNMKFSQTTPAVRTADSDKEKDTENGPLPTIKLKGIYLDNFNIDYDDEVSKTKALVLFDQLQTHIKELDLNKNEYNIDEFLLKDAIVNAQLFMDGKNSEVETEGLETVGEEIPVDDSLPLKVILGKLDLDNLQLTYDNTAEKNQPEGMDFNHLNFPQINFGMKDFLMENGSFSGKITKGEVKEKSGLNIQKLETEFLYGENESYAKNLILQTPNTVINNDTELSYLSIDDLTENSENVVLNLQLKNSKLGIKDALLFAPDLKRNPSLANYTNAVLNTNAEISGTMDDVRIHNFNLSGLDNTKISLSGNIKNAMDTDNLRMDLNIKEFKTQKKTIQSLAPKGSIPDNIDLPENIAVNGTVKGGIKAITADLNLNTSDGNAVLYADVDMHRENEERFDINGKLDDIRVGKIIKNPEIGNFTGKITAKGVGFDPKTMNADLSGKVNSVQFKGYNYRDMDLSGSIHNGDYLVKLDSRDPNADLSLTASGAFEGDLPTLNADGEINKLDLHILNLYEEPMTISGKISSDFKNLDPDSLNGFLKLENFQIEDGKNTYPIRNLVLNAVSNEDKNEINLKSQIIDLDVTGKYKLTQLADALLETVNTYYEIDPDKSSTNSQISAQQLSFSGTVKNDALIQKFLPELTDFDDISLNGSFNSEQNLLEIHAEIPSLIYGDNGIENTVLDINPKDNQLNYNLKVGKVINPSLELEKIALKGNVADNRIYYHLTLEDERGKNPLKIAGTAKTFDDIIQVALENDGLRLNYQDWKVAENNQIQISDKGIWARDFVLSNGDTSLSLNSQGETPESPLKVDIKDFAIETITALIKKESIPANGIINGSAVIQDLKGDMKINSNLSITDLEAMENPLGDLAVSVNTNDLKEINVNASLAGHDNDISLKGIFDMENSGLDFDLLIKEFQMKTVEGFVPDQLENSEGYVSGNLKITGTADSPKVLGQVKFNDAAIEIVQTGSKFHDLNDAIAFTERGIELDTFRIHDNEGNPLTVNGNILTTDYQDYKFDLTVDGKDFLLVNAEKDLDKLTYGKLALDVKMKIGGDLDMPKVDGDIIISENTDFTFVLPHSDPQLQASDGIVEFVDKTRAEEPVNEEELTVQEKLKGLNVNFNIEVDKKAKASVLVDKINGDMVQVQGDAKLTGGIDPSGKVNLTGVYEVEEGFYELSVSLIKKKFELQKGSTITWNGDPMKAQLDFTAVYTTDAAPIDLLQQQLQSMPPAQLNQYKQKLPFHTLLKMEGELLEPKISFDITTDETNYSVSKDILDNTESKLLMMRNEPSEMNKQVFALLLMNRFIGEDPFSSLNGTSAESIAKESVSRILSEQLNNLAADLIHGVDINFDLENTDDYSSGEKNERTDLKVDLSKRFLNDRLTVTVGSSFGVMGDARENEDMSNLAGNIILDYALSRDGRYMLRAFRKDEYRVALQGQVTETGVGFIITLDYDRFREIFHRKKARQESEQTQTSSK